MIAPFAAGLAAKVSVVIDGGEMLHLDALAADVRLRTIGVSQLSVSIGGDAATATAIGVVRASDAVACVLGLLRVLAEKAPRARMREAVRMLGPALFKSAVAGLVMDGAAPVPRTLAQPIGIHRLPSGEAVLGVALPFGHVDSDALDRLLELARRFGVNGLRTAPGRALLLTGLPADKASELRAEARCVGLCR